MVNRFRIPNEIEKEIRARDKRCVYCHKKMTSKINRARGKDYPTFEHFNMNVGAPNYWDEGLRIEDIAICCNQCNASRGSKKLPDWFRTKYCTSRNINGNTVADIVKKYLRRRRKKVRY